MPVTSNNFGLTGFAFPVTAVADYPDITDVREGVAFDSGSLIGVLSIPGESNVRRGVGYGANGTELTGTLFVPAGNGSGSTGPGADIQAALVAFLQSRASVTDLLGQGQKMRLYPEFAPPEALKPYATYKLLDDNRPLVMEGKAGFGTASILIEIWGQGETQGHKMANDVYLALWGTPETPCLDGYNGLMGEVWVHVARCHDGAKVSPEQVNAGKAKPAAAAAITVDLTFDDL